jgi:translocation and assembly module TamB
MQKVFLIVLGIILGLPLVLLVAVLILANTGFGERLIESQATGLTNGMVRLSGLSGRFPDALRLHHFELRDRYGVWLSADAVVLDWSPFALAGGTAHIEKLTAARLTVARAPAPPAKLPPKQAQSGFSLPVSVKIDSLSVGSVDIGAPLAGYDIALSLHGQADVRSLSQGRVILDAARLNGAGTYTVNAALNNGGVDATVKIAEAEGGLIAGLAKLPALAALNIAASVNGPKGAEVVRMNATAGPLSLAASGTVDLQRDAATLEVTAQAPAMSPRPDLGWQSVALAAHVDGPFSKPDATAHAAITGLRAGGASLASLTADVSGNRGQVALHAVLDGTHLPGPNPDLFAGAPIDLSGGMTLNAPGRPVHFALKTPLLTADGNATTAGAISATVQTRMPDIAPLAAMGKVDLRGPLQATAKMAIHGQDTEVSVDGRVDFIAGQAPVPALLGPTQFSAAATLAGQEIIVHDVSVQGRALTAQASGTDKAAKLDILWHVALSDLSALAAQAGGALTIGGHVTGPQSGLAVEAKLSGEAGTAKFPRAPVTASLSAQGLPAAPEGTLNADFRMQGAPATVVARVNSQAGGALHAVIEKLSWKSLSAKADVTMAKGASLPTGKAEIQLSRLADFSAFTGQSLSGSLTAKLDAAGQTARVTLTGSDLSAAKTSVQRVAVEARASGLPARPDIHATADLNGIAAGAVSGQARFTADGRLDALAITTAAGVQNLQGAPAHFTTSATIDANRKTALLRTLQAGWKTLNLTLGEPARIGFGERITVDRLRIALNQARLAVDGTISPALNITATASAITPDLARAFMPTLRADGVVSADAHLSGTLASPSGTIHLYGSGLRMRGGAGGAAPPASITATATLDGRSATVNGQIGAGPKLRLTAYGSVPLAAGGPLAVHTAGRVDVSLLNPILQAQGRQAAGIATLDITASGTTTAPMVAGGVTLAGGDIQDFTQGLHLSHIAARLDAAGNTLRITRLTADAAPGTIAVTGQVGVTAPGVPVDLHVQARNARPLASDLFTAWFDADLAVHGQAQGTLQAAGAIKLHRAEINIPDSLPPSVAVLHVRRPGEKPPPPSAAAPPVTIRLAIGVDAPSNIFVRGHGLYAELGGKLTVGGTAATPDVGGAFDMRQGDFSLAGTTLNFTKGTVGFNGAGVLGRIDPSLDFEADSYQGGITATLKITGYADAPKITLSSVPDLPQDEVLAHLLFGESVKQLSPIQIAEIGAALAELSGVTGGEGPLGSIRKGLGLDRLNVGGGTNGAGASVEAGRYVAKGVYVGAKQSTSGAGGTQAQVQVDLTRHLKLTTTLGTGGGSVQGATPDNDPGSSVGLAYQFEY